MSGHLWSHDRDLWPRWRHQWESVGDMKQTCCCYQCQFLTLVSIEKVFCSSVLKRMYCERCLLKHLQFIAKTFLVASKTFSKDHLLFPSPQTFCFIEKEWWKLWDKTKWINMVSWQFCHLQVVNLQNCTKWPACKVTMDIPSNFQVKSNSTWFTLLVPRDWTWMLVFVWSVFRCICSHTCLLILFGSQMYFYLMFIVLLFTDPIWYSYARFQKCEMWWKDYLMHKNNPAQYRAAWR